ncbi:hypothetical protein RB195_008239 [Necator americanus]|uniref:Uncharacterized protein n=1 Tax=Necator americanus TaxID=51031 RepID=A0ABR1CMM5_NECAM
MPEEDMESLGTEIRLVTLNWRSLPSELQQAALSTLLRYLHPPSSALQERHTSDRLIIGIENYTIYLGDVDERKVDYNNLVEELGSAPSKCAFVRLRNRRGLELWIVLQRKPLSTTTRTRFTMNSMR